MVQENIEERIIASYIQKDESDQRLDIWLSHRFTYHSRQQWQHLIKEGLITLNGKKTRASRKIRENDIVKFNTTHKEPDVDFRYDVVFEDKHMLIVNKSGNLPCHPAGPFFKNTLWYILKQKYGSIYIINRLDRETSGLVIVAKNSVGASALSSLFASSQIQKKYFALVHGQFSSSLTADGYLINDSHSIVHKKRRFVYKIKSDESTTAETATTVLTPLTFTKHFSLVIAMPKTGRLHQIRASLHSLGFPIVGDKLYGIDERFYLKFAKKQLTDTESRKLIISRQALHASELSFVHPFNKKEMCVEAVLPDELSDFIDKSKLRIKKIHFENQNRKTITNT